MLFVVKHLLAKISDAFWCALNAQVLDQLSCRRDFSSRKFATEPNLAIASRLEFVVECYQALGRILHVVQLVATGETGGADASCLQWF